MEMTTTRSGRAGGVWAGREVVQSTTARTNVRRRMAREFSEMSKPMWTCPDCGRSFANLNQTHTCAVLGDLDRHFAKRAPELRALFDVLAKAVTSCGPAEVLSEKTRIAFHRRMSFLSVYPRKNHLI